MSKLFTTQWYEQHQARRLSSRPKPEQVVCHGALAAETGKAVHTESIPRIAVKVVSYRRRLLDPDNLAGGCKFFLDCCKFSRLIPDDRPQDITFEARQEKVKTKTEERTEITIQPI